MTTRLSRSLARLSVIGTLVLLVNAIAGGGTPVAGQSAQVAAGGLSRVPAELAPESLARELIKLRTIRSDLPRAADQLAVDSVIDAGVAALGQVNNQVEYLKRAEQYRVARDALATRIARVRADLPPGGSRGGAVVQPGLFRGNVVFTLGSEVSFGSGSSPAASATIATNLLGASVAAIFDAIGSEALEEYFTKNIAAGTSIPLGNQNSLTAQIGVGLGSIKIRNVELWPVINFEQTDTDDTRTPDELESRFPQQKVWSAPTFALGIVLPGFSERLRAKGVAMVPVVGIRAPHYFPGDPFTALAAMFSSKRSDYERSGTPLYSFGLAVPLVKIE